MTWRVRNTAIYQLTDQTLLTKISKEDKEPRNRTIAEERRALLIAGAK
jgi:hypothetical protein